LIAKGLGCRGCPLQHIGIGFVPPLIKPGPWLVVGEAPGETEAQQGIAFSGSSGRWLQNMAKLAGIDWQRVSLANTICCRPPDNSYPTDPKSRHYISAADAVEATEHCKRTYLDPAVRLAANKKIFAVGGQSLRALTGRSGIMTWRGSPLPLAGGTAPRVMPLIHPAALMRQAKFTSVTVGDLRKNLVLPPENYNLHPTLEDVVRFKATEFAFDFEWDRDGISLCGLSDRFYQALVVPFRGGFIQELQRIFESATSLIGHNIIGADLLWIERLGWKLRDDLQIEDTMLKQHLCQPDFPHGLDFVASVFTNKVFWKGKGWEEMDEEHEGDEQPGQQWRTYGRSDALPRSLGGYGGCSSASEAFALYNARDTDAEFQINTPLSRMLEKWDLTSLYRNVSRPAGFICRDISERGLRLDTSRLAGIRATIDTQITALEKGLPAGLAPYERTVGCNLIAPVGTYRSKEKVCKGTKKNPHDTFTIIFNSPADSSTSCLVCGRVMSPGKMVIAKVLKGTKQVMVIPYNSPKEVAAYAASLKCRQVIERKTGQVTTGKAARGIWAREHPEFTLLGELKKQLTLRNNFAKDSLLGLDRMFFNLKVHGTNEGRLSSSGRRRGLDLNIQNQPAAFRGIYIPERSDWGFVNIDISQGESWLTCWLAQDWDRWAKLQTKGYDEHSELASAIFGKSITKAHTSPKFWHATEPTWTDEQCTAEALRWDAYRQVGKKTNHASAYGMGYKTYHQQLVTAGYTEYKESDTKGFLEEWKKLNPGTVAWQKRTVAQVASQGYLRNAFGRVRWFSSRDSGTQCLAFLPASTLADLVIRMMIAHYPGRFRTEIDNNNTKIFHEMVPEWIMSIMVHDSLVMQGPWETRQEQIERSTQIMSQEWPELNNFRFQVDVKSSQISWGDC